MENKKLTGYELSRNWFDFCFENPELIKPNHTAIYFFAVEHCNRLGHKEKFGFPSQMVMEAVGIKNWRTYSKALNDLVDFGFIQMVEISKNQYSSNIIAIVKNTKANTKALDKALQKHSTKQGQSNSSIDKQYNNITNNNITIDEEENLDETEIFSEGNYSFSSDLLKDASWVENISMKNKTDLLTISKYLTKFDLKLKTEFDEKTNKKDYAGYFSRWFSVQLEKEKKELKNQKEKLTGAQAFAKQFE